MLLFRKLTLICDILINKMCLFLTLHAYPVLKNAYAVLEHVFAVLEYHKVASFNTSRLEAHDAFSDCVLRGFLIL